MTVSNHKHYQEQQFYEFTDNNIFDETQEEINARHVLTRNYEETDLNLTEEQLEFFNEKLSSKLWRMDNLYTIRDKNSTKMIMRLNNAQRKVLTEYRHNKKIILKSRQQGISTLFLAYNLDSCIFKPGFQAGIQSYGQDEAYKLTKRVELMWDEFPQEIKDILNIRIVAKNNKGITFSNGSILKIGNFRGDTLQSLHVSELGKIAKVYPEKAKELKTGAFQAISVNNNITIESTAEGKTGLFAEMWFKAWKKKEIGTKLTPLDFQAIFLSWVIDPDCRLQDEQEISEELAEYFEEVEKHFGFKLDNEAKWWYVAKEEELGHDMKQEYPTTPEEAFMQSLEGTILRKEYQYLIDNKKILKDLAVPKAETVVAIDIGVNDKCVLTFSQKFGGKHRVVMTYANTGEGIDHYVSIMRATGFKITTLYLPHDANVQEYGSGMTRLEKFRQAGFNCILLPRLTNKEYIESLRGFIKDIWIDEDECDETITAIQEYRWKFDKRLQVFLTTPEHDDNSNYIDSLKYLGLGLGYYRPKDNSELRPKKKQNFRSKGYDI